MCIMVSSWIAIGFEVAFHKARRGRSVGWIGTTVAVENGAVVLGVNKELWAELTVMSKEFLAGNAIPLRAFRKHTGKCNFVATIIPMWRPFLDDMWGVIAKHTHRGTRHEANYTQCHSRKK